MGKNIINEQMVLRLAEDVTFQSLGEGMETVVLALETGILYSCNQTTESLLKLLAEPRNFGEAINLLYAEYDVDRELLKNDLMEVVQEMLAEGLLRTPG